MHDGNDNNDDDGVTQHGGHALTEKCTFWFVAEVCHLFFAGFSKKRKQRITEVDQTFCTEAKKKFNRKQELTGEEVAKESHRSALGKEAEQYGTML